MDKMDGMPIAYVYCLDSAQSVLVGSDTAGIASIVSGDYSFTTSHVSYRPVNLVIDTSVKDTIIFLERTTVFLDNAIVSGKRKRTRSVEIGNYGQHKASRVMVRTNAKVGMVVLNTDSTKYRILKSIKFKVAEKEFKGKAFELEIKLYGISNNNITESPLNSTTIFLNSNEVGKRNKIVINEKIPMPN